VKTVEVPCSCPRRPHKHDTVSMPDVADVRIGAAVMAAVNNTPSSIADMEGAISAALLHAAPRAWSFTDEAGEPLSVTIDNIDARLTWTHGGLEVAEKANELYAGDVFDPFVKRMQKASGSGPTGSSTSAPPEHGSSTDSSDKPSLRAVTGGKRSGAKAS
jgi:hypothetical protein